MNHDTFNQIVADRFQECKNVLVRKNHEYSSGDDRLHNFKKAARMKGQDPIQALDGMWLKHRVSVDDMVERLIRDPEYIPDQKLISEKFGDLINYALLLEGLIEGRRDTITELLELQSSKADRAD